MTDDTYGVNLVLAPDSGQPTPPDLRVVGFEGVEEIARPYRFEIDLESPDPAIDVLSLVHLEATLVIEYDQTRRVHGIITEAVQSGPCGSRRFAYRITLAPAMSKLALSRQSQIYGTSGPVNVLDIVEMELTGRLSEGSRDESAAHIRAEDLEIRVPRDEYPSRDYVVQYEETDLAFISRLMEHRGVFFFFDHSGERERMIIGDHNASFDPVAGPDGDSKPRVVEFRPPATGRPEGLTSVHTIDRHCRPLPAKHILREHNYRGEPGSRRNPQYLHIENNVVAQGHGVEVGYDDHFRDHEEGHQISKARVQAMLCRQDVFTGTSDCYLFNAGHLFELGYHFNKHFNQTYLIDRVRHRGGTRLPEDGPDYLNEFTAIPATTPYRPRRRTPKPVVPGVFSAYVDGSGKGLRALIDDSGRYRIRVPFDLSGAEEGMGSRYMRMAQPYANFAGTGGGSSGMHFPLLKGTEVLCACLNGNPDRPVILSAIPIPHTKSPVTGRNANQNRIRTTSGILMEFNDGSPSSSG